MTRQPRLLLLTPVGNDADCWTFAGLGQAAQIFEYPGHGHRELRSGWTLDGFADEVAGSVEAPVDVVGVSMGGAVVVQLLARHPGLIRSAVIACSGVTAWLDAQQDQKADRRRALRDRGTRGMTQGMSHVVGETLERWFSPTALRERGSGVEYAVRRLEDMRPEAWRDVWSAYADAAEVDRQRLAEVDLPVTLLAGRDDAAAGSAGLIDLHRTLGNSRLESIVGPHMLHLERPLSFRSAVARHLAWVSDLEQVPR